MRTALVVLVALGLLGAAQFSQHAQARGGKRAKMSELAPSPVAARLLSLGYRELCADLFYTRGLAMQGGRGETLAGIVAIGRAATGCDPHYVRVYEWLPTAAQFADEFDDLKENTPQIVFRTAIDFLEPGIALMPREWKVMVQAGQIYSLDLKSDDAAQVQAWRERGAELLERAIRLPGAPRKLAALAAHMRTKLGQRERARDSLREMIATSTDPTERAKLAEKLAVLDAKPADDLIYEYELSKAEADRAWQASRPELPFADQLLYGLRPTVDLNPQAALRASANLVPRAAVQLPSLYEAAAEATP